MHQPNLLNSACRNLREEYLFRTNDASAPSSTLYFCCCPRYDIKPFKCHKRLYKQIKFGIDILLTNLKEHDEQRIALCLYNILDEEF